MSNFHRRVYKRRFNDGTPLVSCILTTYNRESLLSRALNSIINQSYKKLQIIIVDDGSTDRTAEVVMSYSEERIIYVRHVKNLGLAKSRNTGMQYSAGEYVTFLDDDDEWAEKKIEKQLECFETSSCMNLGMVSCGIRRIKSGVPQEFKESLWGDLSNKIIIDQPLVGNGSCVMVTKKACDDVGLIDERIKRGIDGFLFFKIAQNYQIDYCEDILVNYYEDGFDRITTFQSEKQIHEALDSDAVLFSYVNNHLNKKRRLKNRFFLRQCLYCIALNRYSDALGFFIQSLPWAIFDRKIILIVGYLMFPVTFSGVYRKRIGLKFD